MEESSLERSSRHEYLAGVSGHFNVKETDGLADTVGIGARAITGDNLYPLVLAKLHCECSGLVVGQEFHGHRQLGYRPPCEVWLSRSRRAG
jgi:hypothetical protein